MGTRPHSIVSGFLAVGAITAAVLLFTVDTPAAASDQSVSAASKPMEDILNKVTQECQAMEKIDDPVAVGELRAHYIASVHDLQNKVSVDQAAVNAAAAEANRTKTPQAAGNLKWAQKSLADAQNELKYLGVGFNALDKCAKNRLAALGQAAKPVTGAHFDVACAYTQDKKVLTFGGVPKVARNPDDPSVVGLYLVNDDAHGGMAKQQEAYNDDPGLGISLTAKLLGKVENGRVVSLFTQEPLESTIDMNSFYVFANWDGTLNSTKERPARKHSPAPEESPRPSSGRTRTTRSRSFGRRSPASDHGPFHLRK